MTQSTMGARVFKTRAFLNNRNDSRSAIGDGSKGDLLISSGVGGKGLADAPDMAKEFNSKSKAAGNAGKK